MRNARARYHILYFKIPENRIDNPNWYYQKIKETFNIDSEQVRNDPYSFDMHFELPIEEGYKNVIVSKSADPGDSEITPKEKDLIKDIKYLDEYIEYRESVHGKKSGSDTVTLDSLRSLGKISMPPVNTVTNSVNFSFHSSNTS